MDLQEELIKLKKSRLGNKKKSLNITVVEERLTKIESMIASKCTYYELLGPSDRLDFCLYILEKYMTASPLFAQNE